ncbi:hypothetical protein KCP78_04090 [Salmonella enterica subsp. enterica]|nr:hypothetical protein KCP78_04090 [Salmonella enterica subsp. enterica]
MPVISSSSPLFTLVEVKACPRNFATLRNSVRHAGVCHARHGYVDAIVNGHVHCRPTDFSSRTPPEIF